MKLIKTLLIAFVVGSMVFAPAVSLAATSATNADLQAQINSLLKIVAQLQVQLATTLKTQNVSNTNTVVPTTANLVLPVGDATTTTSTPSITVLSPNGGETIVSGQTYKIKWTGGNNAVDVYLLDNPTRLGKKIFSGIANNGYIDWIVSPLSSSDLHDPATDTYKTPSGKYVVWVGCTDNSCIVDDSNAPFSIVAVGTPTINVLSPNGGETLLKGTAKTIKWQDSTPIVCSSAVCTAPTYDIRLLTYYPPCTTNICPTYVVAPYTIAKYASGSSYNWSVGKVMDVNGNNIIAPDGSYTVQVCQAGTLTCDSSNSYFKITSSSLTNTPPKIITESTMPSNIQPGQSVSFSWLATDVDNDNLSWEIAWGDGTVEASVCQTPNPRNGQNWKFTASHAWAKAGAYPVKVQVNDCNGVGDSRAFIVNVGDVANPTITVLSPNGGETLLKGTAKTIKWQDSTPIVCSSAVCTAPTYDIRLLTYYPPCTTNICPTYVVAPYTIAKYASGSSYNWSVGKVMDVNGNNIIAPDGSYTVQVCQAGTLTCDSSNSYFKITSSSTANTLESMKDILNQMLKSLGI